MKLRLGTLGLLSSLSLFACGHGASEPRSAASVHRGSRAQGPAGYGTEEADKSSSPVAAADEAGLAPASPAPMAGAGERAPRAEAEMAKPEPSRPGLGTSWGEAVESHVRGTAFSRADGDLPAATASFFYNDEAGASAMAGGRYVDWTDSVVPVAGGRITVSLTDASGTPLRAAEVGGRTVAVGSDGDRYVIRVDNHSPFRLEAVASVDGLDVVDGEDGDLRKRGYVLAPYDTLQIEGFRESEGTVRAFRFGAVDDSYAERRGKGRNVGVVGVAVFRERGTDWRWTPDEVLRRESADPFPSQFAPAPPSRAYRVR